MPPRYDPIHDVLIDEKKEDGKDKEESSTVNGEPQETMENAAHDAIEPPSKEIIEDSKVQTIEPPNSELKNEDTEPETIADAPPSDAPNNTIATAPEESTDTPNQKKHKLSPSPTKVHLKKTKKSSNKSATVLSSARSRHLKKDDGKPFLRKDIQYQFLKDLFEDKTRAFSDPHSDSRDRVITEPDDNDHKLTFAELYIKTIAHSSKCSKILRDRLLNDMKMSIPTSMICLLVNVGRMNTTINFVPDMKSQLRTYHSIPCLQVDYDASENKFTTSGNGGDKQLQDTPRLKSILKACCDDTDEPNALVLLEEVEKLPKTSVINVIFLLCNAEESINKKYLEGTGYNFFDIFLNSDFDPYQRALLFQWLVYTYLETNLKDEEIAHNPYGPGKPPVLTKTDKEQDIETPEEIEFGDNLYEQRVKFLAEDEGDIKKDEKSEAKKSSTVPAPAEEAGASSADSSDQITKGKINTEASNVPLINSKPASKNTSKPAPAPKPSIPLSKQVSNGASQPFSLPLLPKSDIDTDKVKKSLKYLARIFSKKRDKMGQVRYEHKKIVADEKLEKEKEADETSQAGPPPTNNRMRLKNYKGDYVENSDKFFKLFNLLKNDFVEMTKADEQKDVTVEIDYTDSSKDLSLKSFDLDF